MLEALDPTASRGGCATEECHAGGIIVALVATLLHIRECLGVLRADVHLAIARSCIPSAGGIIPLLVLLLDEKLLLVGEEHLLVVGHVVS